jgi:CheY-like chemotaxis protein
MSANSATRTASTLAGQPSRSPSPKEWSPAPNHRTCVLVVDDDLAVRESLSKVLQEAGYDAVLAADGQEALKRFTQQQIDLLILDLGVPIECGWGPFEQITSEHPSLPIIIITGQPGPYDAADAAGVGPLMEKPLDAPQLLNTLRETLVEAEEVRLPACGHDAQPNHISSRSSLMLKRLRERHPSSPRSMRLDGGGH